MKKSSMANYTDSNNSVGLCVWQCGCHSGLLALVWNARY